MGVQLWEHVLVHIFQQWYDAFLLDNFFFFKFRFSIIGFLQDFEHLGRAFCETLMDYYDENPIKVKRVKIYLKYLKRIRKRERKARKAAKKAKKLAEDQLLLNDQLVES